MQPLVVAPSTAPWTEAHVRRLFWRAGFGATPEEAALFAKRGKEATIRWLLNGSGKAKLSGPGPLIDGKTLDPTNEWGHSHLWWLDRMVRSNRPLVEKMTLFWHDHFATRDQDTPLMLRQNKALRGRALGDFRTLLTAVTLDPAMQLFLSLAGSNKWAPNENFARELMELFALGSGYSERDIREAARALTGFEGRWSRDGQFQGIRFNREWHDTGRKKIFHKRGRYGWRDAIDLVLDHPKHAPFMVGKLWSFFITTPIDRRSRARLVGIYRRSGLKIKPVVGEILAHPALYRNLDNPDMVKSPVVYVAGSLRQVRRGIDMDDWTWLMDGMGQMLFQPPSVAGWDWGPTWLSTNSMRARFEAVNRLVRDAGTAKVDDATAAVGISPADAVAQARAAVGMPWASPDTLAKLEQLAARMYATPNRYDRKGPQRAADMAQRALRHLLLSGPDAHLH